MAVLIEGIEIPDNCFDCSFMYCRKYCMVNSKIEFNDPEYSELKGRYDGCPLVPVSEPHGRLIDADALHKLFEDQWHYLQVLDWNENPTAEAKQSGINWCINTMHDSAPTVIPATEEAE